MKNLFHLMKITNSSFTMSAGRLLMIFLLASTAPSIVSSGPSLKELRQEKRSGDKLQETGIVRHQRRAASISSWAEIEKQPYFLETTNVITVQEGGHAFFTCKVENLYNQTVSWIRSKDSYMLYIGDVKFVDDDRFELLSGSGGYGDWTLRFRLIREADAGSYECQISTSPKLSQIFTLNVVVPHVSIAGDKEMHVEAGSSVVLKCTVSDYLKRPTYIFWYLNDQRLVSSAPDIGIEDNVQESKSKSWMDSRSQDSLYSILSVREANGKFSGKYSCVPDNLRPASINVHVILDENPAAMQREVASGVKLLSSFPLCLLTLALRSIYT